MPDDPVTGDDELAATCEYLCNGVQWEFVGGTAPEGYYCESVFGNCLEGDEGQTMMAEPVPNSPPAFASIASVAATASSFQVAKTNSAEYQFDRATDTLYFSRGRAEKGFKLHTKISMSELHEQFPAVAAEVELLKNAKSLASFKVIVPAVPRQEPKA
jgi:hypothetical protein